MVEHTITNDPISDALVVNSASKMYPLSKMCQVYLFTVLKSAVVSLT